MNSNIIFQNQEVQEVEEAQKVNEESLSSTVKNILKAYSEAKEKASLGANQPRVKVGETLGSVAWIYEKIRNSIDYKGEHLLRRNAVERILRRLLWEKSWLEPEKLANFLIKELIWARYLKNDSVPKNKAEHIAKILEKYFRLGFERQYRSWLLGMASCEIEEELVPELFYIQAYTQAMYVWFLENFDWTDQNLSPEHKNIQILIAIHRSLPKSDDSRIRYHLLKLLYPDWPHADDTLIAHTKENLFRIHKEMEEQINNPLQLRLYRYIQKQTAPFQILKDIIDENQDNIHQLLENPQKLEWKIREVCTKRYLQIRERVNRGIVRSIIYIFITKVLLAFIIEIPYEMFIIKHLNRIPIIINGVIPPTLMFLVGLTIRRPDEANTERIVEKIKSFVYPRQSEEKTRFSLAKSQQSSFMNKVFYFIYFILFIAITGGIAYGLDKLHFNVVSAMVFFVFLSMVLLFGYRVRFAASELMVISEKEGFLSHLFTNLTLPFLRLGFWLSRGLSKLNFLIIFMDFLIEAPLKIIIEVVDEWTSFIREKREELVEVPPT